MSPPVECPCASAQAYALCCSPLHHGAVAATAEALMRSRYSAYVLQLEAYLLASWHVSTRPTTLALAGQSPATRWLGLRVLRHERIDDDNAIVEFVAKFKVGGGSAQRLHETSRFRREAGRWYYVDGSFTE